MVFSASFEQRLHALEAQAQRRWKTQRRKRQALKSPAKVLDGSKCPALRLPYKDE
jgi:hypothetical protein